MEPLIYVIAILGCGEGDAPCREVAVAPVRYASEAECMAATGPMLMRHSELSFPAIVAQCRAEGAPPQLLRGSEVMTPGPPVRRRSGRFAATAPHDR